LENRIIVDFHEPCIPPICSLYVLIRIGIVGFYSKDEKLKSTFKHPQLKRNVSYRYLIRLELYKIEKHITGEKEYIPWRG